MQDNVRNIVVLGGGTAGWLSACILASKFDCANNKTTTVTLVESPDIPTIGVGEGTVPTMRQTLQMIGVSESDFIRECDVTFKQSIKFVDWLYKSDDRPQHVYHHLFNYPHTPGFDMTPYWLLGDQNLNFANSVSIQETACELSLAPKKITHREFQAPLEYAYHLDALKFAKFLAKHGTTTLGVQHLSATVEDVKLTADGDIDSLCFTNGERLTGDLFVDCSGFHGRLLAKVLGVGFVEKGEQLLVDTAVAMQVPYSDPEREIPPYTIATAQECGWTWDIGLSKRRGVGYVYSSKHTSHERAEEVLRSYVGEEAKGIETRTIPMHIGYREKFWHKNCVAIGLSAGFVEPLEATALLIVEATAKLLAEKLPTYRQDYDYAAKSFNKTTRYAWDRVIDFIKLHYFLTKRNDTQFWIDNQDESTVPASLLEKLKHWKTNVPTPSDFFSKYEVFQLENYQYVLYGMDYETDLSASEHRFTRGEIAAKELQKLAQQAKLMSQQLDSHRSLIEKIKQHGLSKI